jgi:hypothetical protein
LTRTLRRRRLPPLSLTMPRERCTGLAISTLALLVSTARAQQPQGVVLEPFIATQFVPGDRPSTFSAYGCSTAWKPLSNRVGVRATYAPWRTKPRIVVDGSFSVGISRSFDCLSIPRPTGPAPGMPLRYSVGLGDGRGAFGLLRLGVRAVERRRLTAVIGAGAGAMAGVSNPVGTAGGHLEFGGLGTRFTAGVDWLISRARVRTETIVQTGNVSTVERTDSPHTVQGALLRVGFTFPVP